MSILAVTTRRMKAMLSGVSRLPGYMREHAKGVTTEDKPRIADIYKAGKSMGLTRQDIIRLYHRSNRGTKIKSLFSRHWRIFLPVIVLSAIFIFFLLSRPYDPWSSYPRGALYGVTNTRDFRKRLSLSKTSFHP